MPSKKHGTNPSPKSAQKIPIKKSKSMEIDLPKDTIERETKKKKVLEIILNKKIFNDYLITQEVNRFFGPLGLHEFYFAGHSPEEISEHIQSLFASKLLSRSTGNEMDVRLAKKTDKEAFFATKSNVQGNNIDTNTTRYINNNNNNGDNNNAVEKLERMIENEYLSGGSDCIGDGVVTGYEHLNINININIKSKIKNQYRLQCYRSSGVLDENLFPSHIRMYFLQKPDYVNPNPSDKINDINQLADKRFLLRAGDNLKKVYQECLTKASSQLTPAFHTEIWQESTSSSNGPNDMNQKNIMMARLSIAYKASSTHSYFSSIADVYRSHGFFSTRKYVEFFSNGVVIYGFYLQLLSSTEISGQKGLSFEKRLANCVADCSLHFVLPRTSLTPMLQNNLLTPHEISYAYASWKFTFHFLHRLPDEYQVISNSLKTRDNEAYQRLEKLRNMMKFNMFTEAQILDSILTSPSLVKLLYQDFYNRHNPTNIKESNKNTKADDSLILSNIRKKAQSEQELDVFFSFLLFNKHILKCNFYYDNKSALAFRLDGNFLSKTEFPETPYAIIFVIGSEFRGFHVRFLDIARGGIRMIRSSHAQVFLKNVSSLFDECYSLASTQQRKNKDIPEGGSKGVILLNQAHQLKADVAFQKYIDALLDIMLYNNYNEKAKEELLFLGPDEGTAHLMDWASLYSKKRNYKHWKAFTTGKSSQYGGIPHDVYGMTTHSVRQYVTGIINKLQLNNKKPAAATNGTLRTITKVQTGGPDGDLGSNEILMSSTSEKTIAIVDGSGVLYDEKGINSEELIYLAKNRKAISEYNIKKIENNKNSFLVKITDKDIVLPNGIKIENGTEFRNNFHLFPYISADFFVPCGGRPNAVNLSNVQSFLYSNIIQSNGSLSNDNNKIKKFKYIVEGANLFFTQDARLYLEKNGVILFKDASANKGGVTSSSLEVLAALVLKDEEFLVHMQVLDNNNKPTFYKDYVKEVQNIIDKNAFLEFNCLWNEHEKNKKNTMNTTNNINNNFFCILSDILSERITNLTIQIQTSEAGLWNDKILRNKVLSNAFPKSLIKLIGGIDIIIKRLPDSYIKAVFASQLASSFVYQTGLNAPEFAFYEFICNYK